MSARAKEVLRVASDSRADPIEPLIAAMIDRLDPEGQRPVLNETPRRFASAMRFLTSGYHAELEDVVGGGLFPAEGEGIVLVRDIEFFSLCEHHLLPFFGRVHVAYLPGSRIIGLSKIARIVDLYARRFQVQERLTGEIADGMAKVLAPKGVLVITEARHMCMAMRGVEKQRAATTTRAVRGLYADDVRARREILGMLREAVGDFT